MEISISSDASVPGFRLPVRRSLTEPIFLGGAPRSIAILNGTLAAALGQWRQFGCVDNCGLPQPVEWT
jgi:type IV secretory pathway TrbD component